MSRYLPFLNLIGPLKEDQIKSQYCPIFAIPDPLSKTPILFCLFIAKIESKKIPTVTTKPILLLPSIATDPWAKSCFTSAQKIPVLQRLKKPFEQFNGALAIFCWTAKII